MKKYLLLIVMFSVVFVGCAKKTISEIDVSTITNVAMLQDVVTQISQAMSGGTMDSEKTQLIIEQLQRKYVDLTGTRYQAIDDQFDRIQQIFDAQAIKIYTLPLWAKKLGMSYPVGIQLDTSLSKPLFITTTGYYSSTLVYTGAYDIAMEQAKRIAEKAHLSVSKNFEQAQALAKIGNIDYISGLDIGGLIKGIVYVNHELLDTYIDYLLSVSVDQEGVLTIEATKYISN